jgi:hypothetical protein
MPNGKAMQTAKDIRVAHTDGKNKSTWEIPVYHKNTLVLKVVRFFSGLLWTKVTSRKKMPIGLIAKTVHAELEGDANCKRYPCGPHGPKKRIRSVVQYAFLVIGRKSGIGRIWIDTSHGKKMPIGSITKTVHAELECDADCKRYACATHGQKIHLWQSITTESFFSPLLDDSASNSVRIWIDTSHRKRCQ